MKEEFKTALVQFPCKIGNKQHNINKIAKYAKQAKKQKADIIIFPEMSLTGYTTRDLTYELAEEIPGPSTKKIGKIAKKENLYIIYGMPERSEKGKAILYNTAALTGPEGYVGKYRKMHLPTHSVFEEKRYFRLGYQTPVFETNIGKLGIIICYDIFFPEITRALRLQGAKIIICISASPAVRKKFFETLTTARAIENTCFLAYVNLVGIENGLQFWGGSRLISPSGTIITQSRYNEEDISFGNVNYEDLRPIEAFVPTLRDLRPELYVTLKELSEKL
ncbi:MAG: carbon-nitrogen hydrolase family protein [Candidatus Bathyarchaeota archaeon]|nr:carbon-nitrogen hydrolase family protein [Candidatus Bathyarchaeota archaeon]MDH5494368.1 carbon-nitrogen hydrolase family protein [Candidatus Bathyarchaeota archaeon]